MPDYQQEFMENLQVMTWIFMKKIQLLADSVWGGTGKDAILTIAFIGLLERKRGQHSAKYGKQSEH